MLDQSFIKKILVKLDGKAYLLVVDHKAHIQGETSNICCTIN